MASKDLDVYTINIHIPSVKNLFHNVTSSICCIYSI